MQWLSGRVLDSRPKGSGFEPHRRHCVVARHIYPSLVLYMKTNRQCSYIDRHSGYTNRQSRNTIRQCRYTNRQSSYRNRQYMNTNRQCNYSNRQYKKIKRQCSYIDRQSSYTRECSGSVVECLTRDRRVAGSSLTGVTALWQDTFILA